MSAMLAGRTVLVTGASRGIGRATAVAAHREGASVVLHYGSSRAEAERTAARLGDRVTLVGGDLRHRETRTRVFHEARAWAGRLDVLVNNAGAWLPSLVSDERAWQEGWTTNLTLNLQAPADLCRLAIDHFRSSGGGTIVNVVSRSAHRGDDVDHLAYGAAKGGLLALTKGIARGFGSDGVLAYAVAPGWVATELAAGAAPDAAVLRDLPLGELVPPEDVAEVIVFLASGRSRHSTGSTIDISGADYVR